MSAKPKWSFPSTLFGLCALCVAWLAPLTASASFHLWEIKEVYSNADGSVQFIELFNANNGEQFTMGHTITVTWNGGSNTFTFGANTAAGTANHHLLLATAGFSALCGGVAPNFTLPADNTGTFFWDPDATGTVTIDFVGADALSFASSALPTNGRDSLTDTNLSGAANLVSGASDPTSFAGAVGHLNLIGCLADGNCADCADADYCDGVETTCQAATGTCVGTPPCPQLCDESGDACVECLSPTDCPNDANPCTDRSCAAGSCGQSNNTATCDDGLFCTTTDVCGGGTCSGTGNPCSGGTPFCDETGNDCDACVSPGDCPNDANPCTDRACTDGTCGQSNNTAGCDDGLFCTVTDACSGGGCSGTGNPCSGGTAVCDEVADECDACVSPSDCPDDGNPCTDRTCTAGACGQTDNTAACDDGLFCTVTDACSGGACSGAGDPCSGTTPFCDETGDDCDACVSPSDCPADINPCTDRSCTAGACGQANNTAACDDGLFCTATDVCSGGACQGSGAACLDFCDEGSDTCLECSVDADCEDGDPCTADDCDGSGTCTTGPAVAGTPCADDGLFCTGVEACSAGACVPAGDPCDAVAELCSEAADTCVRRCDDGGPAVAGVCPEDGEDPEADAGSTTDAGADAGVTADAGTVPDAGPGSAGSGAEPDAASPGGSAGTGSGDPLGDASSGDAAADGGSGGSSSDCSCRIVGAAPARSRPPVLLWLALLACPLYVLRRRR